MPIYEYGCTDCSKLTEAFQKISDDPLTICPECGGALTKLISNTSFVLKGGGWYADGYESKSSDKVKSKADTKSDNNKKSPEKSDKKKKSPVTAASTSGK